jgi:hypothetical protein
LSNAAMRNPKARFGLIFSSRVAENRADDRRQGWRSPGRIRIRRDVALGERWASVCSKLRRIVAIREAHLHHCALMFAIAPATSGQCRFRIRKKVWYGHVGSKQRQQYAGDQLRHDSYSIEYRRICFGRIIDSAIVRTLSSRGTLTSARTTHCRAFPPSIRLCSYGFHLRWERKLRCESIS